MKILNITLIVLLLGCNRKEKNHFLTKRTLELPHKNISISLTKDTVNCEKMCNYSLKDNYKTYQLKSFKNKENIKYSGGSIELLKDIYSKKNTGFVLKYATRDYENYTFLEYDENSLFAKYFIEIINTDNKIIAESKFLNDTIIKITTKEINVKAEKFFSDSYIFDSIESKNIKYNFLNRKKLWLNNPNSRQEEWILKHFLYETE